MNISRFKGGPLRLVKESPAPSFLESKGGPVPLFPPRARQAGRGELVFEKSGEKTILRRAYAQSPLKWIKTLERAPAAWVYSSNYGGGLVEGDHLNLDLEVRERALGFVTTQASTKVYRSATAARQTLQARVAGEGSLVWLPDPVVCFEGAHYEQRQDFHLAEGAGIVLQDALTSGRRARGERWKFRKYSSRTRLWRGEKAVFYDALELAPDQGPLGERLGRFNVLALVLVYGAPFRAEIETIFREWTHPPWKRRPSLLEYVSRVGKEGLVWRLAAEDPQQVDRLVRQRLSFLSELLGDDPWARKQGR